MSVTFLILLLSFFLSQSYLTFKHTLVQLSTINQTLKSPPVKSLNFNRQKSYISKIFPNNKQDDGYQVQITIMFRSTVRCAFRGSRNDDDGM